VSTTIDQQFVEFIVKTIVSNPDAVEIKRTIDEKGVLLELTVDPQDLGRVIGKRGVGAQSLRTLLRALGTKNDARYNLKIVDIGEDGEPSPRRSKETTEDSAPAEESVQEQAATEDESTAEKPATDEPEQTEQDDEDDDSESESRASKTRQELADLDDLDI
jgi:predicted RNA-binding protein YlqC (UPF0109 family)